MYLHKIKRDIYMNFEIIVTSVNLCWTSYTKKLNSPHYTEEVADWCSPASRRIMNTQLTRCYEAPSCFWPDVLVRKLQQSKSVMKLIPSFHVKSLSLGQENLPLSWNRKVHYRVIRALTLATRTEWACLNRVSVGYNLIFSNSLRSVVPFRFSG